MIEFKDNTAYHCETPEEAEWLLNQTHWSNDRKERFLRFWRHHTTKTCYNINTLAYCELRHYELCKFTIIKVKDLMQKNMNEITKTENGFIFKPQDGQEIDLEKSDLSKGVVVFKEVKQKYPMDFMDIKLSVNGFSTKLNLFGRLVLACREWNRIDGFENESITKRGVICRYDNCIKAEMWDSRYNAVLVFKDQSTAELFLSTFNKELQEVKEFL